MTCAAKRKHLRRRALVGALVRDDGQRTLLFDLDSAIQRITTDTPNHSVAVPLTGVYHNLLRRWAEL